MRFVNNDLSTIQNDLLLIFVHKDFKYKQTDL